MALHLLSVSQHVHAVNRLLQFCNFSSYEEFKNYLKVMSEDYDNNTLARNFIGLQINKEKRS